MEQLEAATASLALIGGGPHNIEVGSKQKQGELETPKAAQEEQGVEKRRRRRQQQQQQGGREENQYIQRQEEEELEMAQTQQLIPRLPNHIAMQCLIKVPRLYHCNIRGVCKSWSQVLRSEEFYRWRRESGVTDPWLVVLSCDHLGAAKLHFFAYDLPSRQLLFKAPLPPFDLFVDTRGAGSDYKLVAMEEHFVVLNWQRDGMWTEELPFLIYNILTRSWKKGAPVGVRRQSFACGVINGKLYITGGLNLEGQLEYSTECYDFGRDEWRFVAALPEQVVCEDDVVFQGKLYLRTASGLFWVYDPATDEWVQDGPLSSAWRQVGREGQLVATDGSLFSFTRDNAFYRFNWEEAAWQLVGSMQNHEYGAAEDGRRTINCPCSSSNTATQSSSGGHDYVLQQLHAADPRTAIISCGSMQRPTPAQWVCKQARRVFGYGNDIFVLASGSTSGGWHSCNLLLDAADHDGSTNCYNLHRLFLGNSSYRAGAVVHA